MSSRTEIDAFAEAPVSLIQAELVVDQATGKARHAGATTAEGEFILTLKKAAERSLYTFARAILGRAYLTERLHKPVCDWLTRIPLPAPVYPPDSPKRRKALLLPREHAKSSIVSHALPMHMLIQPTGENVYFQGQPGCEQRVVLACETMGRGKDHLGVQRRTWERNAMIRALWPHRCWKKPQRDAPAWNNEAYTIPRDIDWPDPSVRAIGVDGAITGAHPSALVKDDLISIDAANSEQVMHTAIEWHKASRALVNRDDTLEFIIGTRWAVADLYSEIQETDDTVEWTIRSLIEDGEFIYPEVFGREKMAELQKTHGARFFLLYMNQASDTTLVDFDLGQLRHMTLEADGEGGTSIVMTEDGRDVDLRRRSEVTTEVSVVSQENRGKPVSDLWTKQERRRWEHIRLTSS